MTRRKVTTVGNAVGVVLPEDPLARLRVSQGDTIFAVKAPNGVELAPHDPDFGTRTDMAKAVLRKDRDLLENLAERPSRSASARRCRSRRTTSMRWSAFRTRPAASLTLASTGSPDCA